MSSKNHTQASWYECRRWLNRFIDDITSKHWCEWTKFQQNRKCDQRYYMLFVFSYIEALCLKIELYHRSRWRWRWAVSLYVFQKKIWLMRSLELRRVRWESEHWLWFMTNRELTQKTMMLEDRIERESRHDLRSAIREKICSNIQRWQYNLRLQW